MNVNKNNNTIFRVSLALFFAASIFVNPLLAHGARTDHREQKHTSGVYDIIRTMRQQQSPQVHQQSPVVVMPVVQSSATMSPTVPVIPVTTKPIKEKPSAGSVVKSDVIFQVMQRFIPSDPYLEKGFTPITTNILYVISIVVGISGMILIVRRPLFLARRLAALFNFS